MRHALFATVLAACGSSPPPAPTSPAGSIAEPAAPTPAPAARVTPAPPASPAVEQVLAADTPMADHDGNPFIAPAEWKVASGDPMTLLTSPEGDSRVAIVDVAADSSETARDAAWRAYRGEPGWPVLATSDLPDRDGWSRAKRYEYQTSPNEKRAVQVVTRFANDRWCVLIADLSDATAEKRGGQLGKVFSRFFPKGYARESFAGKPAAKLDAARIAALQKFVTDAEQATGVPGVSFGVVQDGKVVWAGGIGVRELGKRDPVDAHTLYMIASNTKALTTLMLAKLVDGGKLAWDQPVVQVLPQFKLGDPEVTKQVLIKHLICACTGMPRQDLEWLLEWKGSTPASVLASLGEMTPTSKFGALFQYSNLMAAAAGYAGGHAAFPALELGAAYDRAMQQLVFDPLKMTSTTFDYAKALRGNHAMPHGLDIDGHPGRDGMEENYAIVSARPAGAAWSNVDDMLKYVAMELAGGTLPDGKPFASTEAVRARWAPNVAISADETYGMGLMVRTKYDVTMVHHGGDLIGYHSDMLWFPDANVGAVILTNGDLGPIIRSGFARKLLEVMYDGKPEADENVATAAKNEFAELAAGRKLLAVPADPVAAGKLATRYKSDKLGDIVVSHDHARTVFDFGEFKSEVGTVANPDGTVTFTTIVTGLEGLGFVPGEAAGKPTLTIRDGQHEYVFTAE
jgi:CubicO group peptidase (beta-lactamase class C family)